MMHSMDYGGNDAPSAPPAPLRPAMPGGLCLSCMLNRGTPNFECPDCGGDGTGGEEALHDLFSTLFLGGSPMETGENGEGGEGAPRFDPLGGPDVHGISPEVLSTIVESRSKVLTHHNAKEVDINLQLNGLPGVLACIPGGFGPSMSVLFSIQPTEDGDNSNLPDDPEAPNGDKSINQSINQTNGDGPGLTDNTPPPNQTEVTEASEEAEEEKGNTDVPSVMKTRAKAFRDELQGNGSLASRLVLGDPFDGSRNFANVEDIRGNLIFLRRGGVTFAVKALRAQEAGAIGVLVQQNCDVWPYTMNDSKGEADGQLEIPVFMIDKQQGDRVKQFLTSESSETGTDDITKGGCVLRHSTDEKRCIICLEHQNPGDEVVLLHCQHRYHKACIVGWLERRDFCPLCRDKVARFTSSSVQQNDPTIQASRFL